MMEQNVEDVAASMASDPLGWARLYLDVKQELDRLVAILELLKQREKPLS